MIVDPQQQPEIAAKAERLRRWVGEDEAATCRLEDAGSRSTGGQLWGPGTQTPASCTPCCSEYVVAISGEVRRRQDPNPKLKTGSIEIKPSSIKASTAQLDLHRLCSHLVQRPVGTPSQVSMPPAAVVHLRLLR